MAKKTHCYVGFRPCGCQVTVIADMQESARLRKLTADSVAECIVAGYRVERIESDRWRQEFAPSFGVLCDKCNPKPQLGLFDTGARTSDRERHGRD